MLISLYNFAYLTSLSTMRTRSRGISGTRTSQPEYSITTGDVVIPMDLRRDKILFKYTNALMSSSSSLRT